ncbi:amino acid transporter [Paenarthrobacter nicotinovorans]|uniref:APC family permease n=1 Tax=Paenarthrobacter nicotinovorans TaxID=29320 RepID=A0ABV0GXB7_PAENI|nr:MULTISPECIES: APC family permease [Micrococcaceae]MDR6436708.1 amino acid transporter [Paenarthrobacter nicotinovorans]SCZ56843.1 Amino acid transporter [Arthrobacter sp. UNCCL28]
MSAEPTKLAPKLSLLSVVVFGLAYMAPGIVISIFGVIAATSEGTAPTAFALAAVAMLLTALSYAKMAKIFPNSGSAYVYARRLLDSRVGFLVGWAILLDYLFLPTVAWLFQSFYLAAQFPNIPVWAWLALNAGLTTIINVTGIVLTDRVNKVLTLLVVTLIGIFIAYCLAYLGGNPAASFTDPFWNNATTVGGVAAAAAIAAYSFLGFDAVSTLSEETKNAERNIPRAILLTVIVGGILFVVVSLIMQLVHPGGDFEEAATAAYAMQVLVGGQFYANVTNILGIIGGFASGLAIQASTSRLLYVMGRDGVLPRRLFGRLNRRTKTPVFNLVLVGAMAMLALNISVEIATSFINFGAFLAFTTVNLCVIAYFIRSRKQGKKMSVIGFIVLPILGAGVDIYLLTQLSSIAITIGLCWIALGVIYLAFLTKGFRKEPPEMRLHERESNAAQSVEDLQNPDSGHQPPIKHGGGRVQSTEI